MSVSSMCNGKAALAFQSADTQSQPQEELQPVYELAEIDERLKALIFVEHISGKRGDLQSPRPSRVKREHMIGHVRQ